MYSTNQKDAQWINNKDYLDSQLLTYTVYAVIMND